MGYPIILKQLDFVWCSSWREKSCTKSENKFKFWLPPTVFC
jgi:hypothetical protein